MTGRGSGGARELGGPGRPGGRGTGHHGGAGTRRERVLERPYVPESRLMRDLVELGAEARETAGGGAPFLPWSAPRRRRPWPTAAPLPPPQVEAEVQEVAAENRHAVFDDHAQWAELRLSVWHTQRRQDPPAPGQPVAFVGSFPSAAAGPSSPGGPLPPCPDEPPSWAVHIHAEIVTETVHEVKNDRGETTSREIRRHVRTDRSAGALLRRLRVRLEPAETSGGRGGGDDDGGAVAPPACGEGDLPPPDRKSVV